MGGRGIRSHLRLLEADIVPLEELAQNGVRRETVPDLPGGARRTLCAFMLNMPQALAAYLPEARFAYRYSDRTTPLSFDSSPSADTAPRRIVREYRDGEHACDLSHNFAVWQDYGLLLVQPSRGSTDSARGLRDSPADLSGPPETQSVESSRRQSRLCRTPNEPS